jgi:cell division protein FtsB
MASRKLYGRQWLAVGVLVLVGLLYYRPLDNYFSSRSERASRVAQLHRLEQKKATLKRKLHEASSPAALAAEERLLGFVRPGDQLYIVKDIPQWLRRQNASRRARSH